MYQKMQLNTHFLLLFVQWQVAPETLSIRCFPFISVALHFFEAQNPQVWSIKFDSKVKKILLFEANIEKIKPSIVLKTEQFFFGHSCGPWGSVPKGGLNATPFL